MTALQRHRLEILPTDGTFRSSTVKLQLLVETTTGSFIGDDSAASGFFDVDGVDGVDEALGVDNFVDFVVDVANLGFGEQRAAKFGDFANESRRVRSRMRQITTTSHWSET